MSMGQPGFDDIFDVMAQASVGNRDARVAVPQDADVDDLATRTAIALNILLEDLEFRGVERERAQDQLRQAQKMDAIGSLASGIAHDFNNLLGVIQGYVEILLDDLSVADRDELQAIAGAAERAADLTRQLLAFSRKQPLNPTAVDLNDLLTSLIPITRRLVGEDIDLRLVAGDSLWTVVADRGQLDQVVINLVVNARDAMPRGGQLVIETRNLTVGAGAEARVAGVRPGDYVMLVVSDTGVGMDRATQERVFEPFFTTKDVGRGTGLGLSTVFGVLKQSGGAIRLASEPGRGATFRIYLPRGTAAPVVKAAPTAPAEMAGGDETILLVEDDDQLRDLLRRVLSGHGYQVLVAASPAAALDCCAAHRGPVDLLLSDVVMPGMSGPELAGELAHARPGLRVLFVSGYPDSTVARYGPLAADAAFLTKPVPTRLLLTTVRQVLDGREGSGAGSAAKTPTSRPGR
ncbi:ATP-binding protein [Pilimelia columellifera]|uniref:histidine kinase n=1 Tax=Pilimelia columellifera subsp. columellifera TaxID=706583 RepID=A0ABN3NK71_9ACTN